MITKRRLAGFIVVTWLITALIGCSKPTEQAHEPAQEQAQFPQAAVDYFKDMDGGVKLDEDEIKGRNTWVIWTAGNDSFWDYMARYSYGNLDFLKTLDSRHRDRRFEYYGLMNEPGFKRATKPDKFGLWLDEPDGTQDPYYASVYHEKFPRDEFIRVYGRASGVVGLRLFPNPAFNAEARQNWDPKRYYTDPSYYHNPKLVRPYRVGMSCGFCHVGPHPVHPAADPEQPNWENLSTNIGSQYFWVNRIFTFDQNNDSFIYQLLSSSPPGTLDTSFFATDNINNPRTMNAIYNVGARLAVAQPEQLSDEALRIQGTEPRMPVPHILKDGADSIGILGALSRVYLNIGEFHEEWIKHFNLLVGGKQQTPMPVAVVQKNSPYWRATEERVGNLAKFFLKAATPQHLKDAPGGERYFVTDRAKLEQGENVFAGNCAACHSSKLPGPPSGVALYSDKYDAWTETADFKRRMTEIVMRPDFLENNYLSNDRRYAVSKIGTNACAALASNGLRGHIWDNFTSETYKNLPSVGEITVNDPLTGKPHQYAMPAGGRGYYRSPSLISLWATAPYFHDNGLGKFTGDPSVHGRMEAFNDAIDKLLWPQKRLGFGSVYRTTTESWLTVDKIYLPSLLVRLLEHKGVIGLDQTELRLGPIPKGTPINLLANINNELSFEPKRIVDLAEALLKVKKALKQIRIEHLGSGESTELLKTLVPDLLKVNKCPDFIVDRGHEYGSTLSDSNKYALIGFLKTF